MRDGLQKSDIEVLEAELTFVPNQTIMVTDEKQAGKIIRLMEALDDDEDVVATHTNFDIAEGLLGD